MCSQVTNTTAGREHTTDNKHWFEFKCKASCCITCSFCTRAFPKERIKSRVSRLSLQKLQIKVCEKCFLCHSIVLCWCPTYNKCQKCCTKSACSGKTSKLLANLAGSGSRSESSSDPKRGLHPPLPDPAKTHKVTHGCKLLCQFPQEQLPAGGITSAYSQECCRTSKATDISGVFQPTIFSPKTQQQVRPILDLSKLNLFLKTEKFKMETPETIRTSLQQGEWVTSIDFKDAYFPYTNTGTVQKISEISCPRSDIPVQGSSLWSVHSTLGVHCNSKRGETDGHSQGYKDPPVPRRLVGEGKILEIMSLPHCPVRQFMSLISLLTATEKQVHLGYT